MHLALGLLLAAITPSGTAQAVELGAGRDRLAAWQAQADALSLAEHPVWQALLHLDGGRPNVNDRSFLLSAGQFSAARELAALLQQIDTDPVEAGCRFPARYEWLRRSVELPPLETTQCPLLVEFLKRAPAESVILAFASENVSQPASIMGHTFLVLRGRDDQGQPLAHAVSFYTDTDTWNVPKLLFDSLVTGKEGLFSLIPYADARAVYVQREQRALWEFPLRLDPEERRRMVLHLHELRDARLTYFFQGYNCATLIKHVLAVARPEILLHPDPWTTPKDVVKHAAAVNLLGDGMLDAPAQWRIRALTDTLPAAASSRARSAVSNGGSPHAPEVPAAQDFMTLELARAYAEAMPATSNGARALPSIEQDLERFHPERRLSIGETADPRHAPPDAQLSVGAGTIGGRAMLQVDLLPISHHLEDWGQQGTAETALSMMEASFWQPLHGGAPRLHRLVLYGVTSILPHDPLVGGISGRLTIGLDDDDPAAPAPRLHGHVGGQLGRAWRWQRDTDAYLLFGGVLYGRAGVQLRGQQEAGLIIREAFGMKTLLSVVTTQHPLEPVRPSTVWRWTQSKQLRPDLGLVLTLRHQPDRRPQPTDAMLQLRWRY